MENNDFYVALLENDLNPFITFDSNGKLKDFNKEAEFLFNYVQPKELYDLAVSYATISFGFNSKFISLKYGKLKFYALMVGYINDDEIGLRLYKEVCSENEIIVSQDIELANIFSLIELSKATTLLQSDIKIVETYDVSIPEVKININDFLLTLNECFEIFKSVDNMELKVYIKMGEYTIIDDSKYQIIAIEFCASCDIDIDIELEKKALKGNINVFVENNILKFEFPMIL